jgi:hypothetical protein
VVPPSADELQFTLGDKCPPAFLKRHRVMRCRSGSWFPMFDRNPQTFVDIYHAKEEPTIVEPITKCSVGVAVLRDAAGARSLEWSSPISSWMCGSPSGGSR